MSYKNIQRNCSVCSCCGACDYDYETEFLKERSGDYLPFGKVIDKRTKKDIDEEKTNMLVKFIENNLVKKGE